MSERSIVLASASPRRRQLLATVGLPFTVMEADIDERHMPTMPPTALAEHLALSKACAVGGRLSDSLVIGADTMVVVDGTILNKPANGAEATDMLRTLSGRSHDVITGVAVLDTATSQTETAHAVTEVTFRPLSEEEIRRYIATGEPFDKAGGYGIQGVGALLVQGIVGCYPNVVGLPLITLASVLAKFDVELL